MFRQIAALAGGVDKLIREPSPFIAARLEVLWAARPRARGVNGVNGLPLASMLRGRRPWLLWEHLIYAYLVENTRAAEIFRHVVHEAAHGERLGILTDPLTHTWLRTTEDLLHSFGVPSLAFSTVSQVRPDSGATRRNAYYRMFGMDLNHSSDLPGGTYLKAEVANRDFVATFEAFLREVWRAIENAQNTSGPNATDSAAIADLARRLQDMLNERRGGAATGPVLAREEFVAVAAMSWLHMTVDTDNAVIRDLKVTAASPEERLRRLGERVGVPSHALSHSYFILAPQVSQLLILIEAGALSTPAQAQALYFAPPPPAANPLRTLVMSVIEHWSRATGRQIKAQPVSAFGSFAPSAPARRAETAAPVPSSNGRASLAKETSAV